MYRSDYGSLIMITVIGINVTSVLVLVLVDILIVFGNSVTM